MENEISIPTPSETLDSAPEVAEITQPTDAPPAQDPIFTLTREQRLFARGKALLAQLSRIEATRPLTAREAHRQDEIKSSLFASVVKFGMKRARERMGKYRLDSDAYADVQQSLAAIFFEKLPAYDPYKSTPTTYYVRYFDQAISEYILSYSQHLSQYDSHNVSLVRAAKHFYESKGIKWDESMLATKTGLSKKVVSTTLSLESNAIYGNVDDALNLASQSLGPEESYIQFELNTTLARVIQANLPEEDYKLFLLRMNLGSGKELSYQAVADALHMQVRDVKKKWSAIVAKLSNCKELRAYAPARTTSRRSGVSPRVSYHSTAAEAVESNILDVMDSILSTKGPSSPA